MNKLTGLNYAVITDSPRPILVGSNRACYDLNDEPGIARLHVWSDDTSPGWPCQVPAGARDFRLKWQDGGALAAKDLDAVKKWLENLPGNTRRILIHCGAGQCRSATLGLVVLAILRKAHPTQFVGEIYRALYEQRRMIADIRLAAMDSITKWWEADGDKPGSTA